MGAVATEHHDGRDRRVGHHGGGVQRVDDGAGDGHVDELDRWEPAAKVQLSFDASLDEHPQPLAVRHGEHPLDAALTEGCQYPQDDARTVGRLQTACVGDHPADVPRRYRIGDQTHGRHTRRHRTGP